MYRNETTEKSRFEIPLSTAFKPLTFPAKLRFQILLSNNDNRGNCSVSTNSSLSYHRTYFVRHVSLIELHAHPNCLPCKNVIRATPINGVVPGLHLCPHYLATYKLDIETILKSPHCWCRNGACFNNSTQEISDRTGVTSRTFSMLSISAEKIIMKCLHITQSVLT